MNTAFASVFIALVAAPLAAQTVPVAVAEVPSSTQTVPGLPQIGSEGVELSQFLWTNRVVAVFADSPNDPRFAEQMRLLAEDPARLLERDVVVIVDTDPAARSPMRQELRPRGFSLVIIGKDGVSKIRKPLPWSVREISRSIDKMPIRQQELRDAKQAP